MVWWVSEGGKENFVFFPLPQNILVPPTPATGRRFPLQCEGKNENFVPFSLTRDAATPRRRALWCCAVLTS